MRVRLAQDCDAAAKAEVIGPEPRPRIVSRPRFAHRAVRDEPPLVGDEVAVVEYLEAMPGSHALPQYGQQRVPSVHATKNRGRIQRRRVRERVTVEASVSRMQVHEY